MKKLNLAEAAKAESLGEFKKVLGEQLKPLEELPGSEKVKNTYKSALFREIAADRDYKKLKKEYLQKRKEVKTSERLVEKEFPDAQKRNPSLTKEGFRAEIMGGFGDREYKEVLKESLLHKPNMTVKDREGMQKAINHLIEKKNDTLENLQKLDDIIYTQESIEIGGVRWAKKDMESPYKEERGQEDYDIESSPHKKEQEDYHEYYETFGPFAKYSAYPEEMYVRGDRRNTIEKLNAKLAKQGMEIPSDSHYKKSMKALPSGSILASILNFGKDGCYMGTRKYFLGEVFSGIEWEYDRQNRRLLASTEPGSVHSFEFDDNQGKLYKIENDKPIALPVRPIFK